MRTYVSHRSLDLIVRTSSHWNFHGVPLLGRVDSTNGTSPASTCKTAMLLGEKGERHAMFSSPAPAKSNSWRPSPVRAPFQIITHHRNGQVSRKDRPR